MFIFATIRRRERLDNVPVLALDQTAYVYAPAQSHLCLSANDVQLVGIAEFPQECHREFACQRRWRAVSSGVEPRAHPFSDECEDHIAHARGALKDQGLTVDPTRMGLQFNSELRIKPGSECS